MDPKLESEIYAKLATRLPGTTIISIAHRESLEAHHNRHLTMHEDAQGRFTLDDAKVAAE